MKKFRIASLCLALVLLVSALPATAQGPVTITISTWAGVEESAELQEILDEINANNDRYQLVHEPMPADYYTQVSTQIAGGVGADLYWMDQNHMALAAEGVLLGLNDCLANAEPNTAGDVNDYYPGILSVNEFDGEIYGLPWIAQPVVTFYNRALFDAAGIDYPAEGWTWDDFIEIAKALTQDTDGDGEIDQWGFTANTWPPFYPWVWQAGGELINEDFTEAPIDSPEFLEGFQFHLDIAYNPEFSASRETIAEQGFNEMFKAGQVAMFMGGAADDLDRVEGLDVGVIHLPAHPETGLFTTFAWNASTVVWAGTENPELACEALLAVTEGIHNWKIVSPRISQGTAEHLVNAEPRKAANAEPIIQAAADMRALPIFSNYTEFDSVLWSQFWGPMINNETDLTLAELAEEVRPELEATLP
ncbi:MAG: sugar ABC transporter substrate-binding protein [Anaerolineae bacterium]|nr:sugar ABC transporter substrate-binding protein [Anaerolineae bacterium]